MIGFVIIHVLRENVNSVIGMTKLEIASPLGHFCPQGITDEYGADAHSCVSNQQLLTWLAECATLMDRAFVEPDYVTSRKMNTIGTLELCLVKRGTFGMLLDCFMTRGAAMTKYKTPRCIVLSDALSILRKSACTTL
ncbi:hypothetical protein L7F22_045123 [Adiantum nelumboides]|nr:hypothetical protein [Adiantum nelumboides]